MGSAAHEVCGEAHDLVCVTVTAKDVPELRIPPVEAQVPQPWDSVTT